MKVGIAPRISTGVTTHSDLQEVLRSSAVRILQISSGVLKIPPEKGGGIETYIFNISRQFAKEGHDVTILDGRYSPLEPPQEFIEGVRILRLGFKRIAFPIVTVSPTLTRLCLDVSTALNQLSFAHSVTRFLNRELSRYDIVLVHFYVGGFLLAKTVKKIGRSLIYTSHTSMRSTTHNGTSRLVAARLENALIRLADKVIVTTRSLGEELIRSNGVDPRRIRIMATGMVDTELFRPDLEATEIVKEYDLDEKLVALFVGRISREKGIHYLIRACNVVVNELGFREFCLLIVGPIAEFGQRISRSPYLKELQELIERYRIRGHVRIVGPVPFDDLRKLYVASQFFVLPSLAEMSPSVLSEAMASGKPVIGTRVGGIPTQIVDGVNGFIVEPGDERQLAMKIKCLLEDRQLRETMGENSRKLAEQNLAWKRAAQELLKFFEER